MPLGRPFWIPILLGVVQIIPFPHLVFPHRLLLRPLLPRPRTPLEPSPYRLVFKRESVQRVRQQCRLDVYLSARPQ